MWVFLSGPDRGDFRLGDVILVRLVWLIYVALPAFVGSHIEPIRLNS